MVVFCQQEAPKFWNEAFGTGLVLVLALAVVYRWKRAKVGTRGRTRARVLLFFQSGAAVFKTRCGQGMKLKHVPAVCAVKMTYCTRSSVIFNLGCRAKPSTACSV